MKVVRVGVLHYHLLRGGVYTVVMNSLRGLIESRAIGRLEIDVITGDAATSLGKDTEAVLRDWMRANGREEAVSLRFVQMDELGYAREAATNREALFAEAEAICEQLLALMGVGRSGKNDAPYVLHVHNANLGKNPRLTLALKLLAERLETQDLAGWILYQMHDFAEDNRPIDWGALRRCSGRDDAALAVEMMYPCNSRVMWAVINSADRERLLAAGLPEQKVRVLPNAVDASAFSGQPLMKMSQDELDRLGARRIDFAADLKKRLAEFAAREGFRFEADRRILLSPIKAIRRKNVLESVLGLMALNRQADEYQLLVTLGANSAADLAYCRALEEFVKNTGQPVVIGFGKELLRPGSEREIVAGAVRQYGLVDLLGICEAVVTTSVQEGFGYVFHEPWLAGKAVVGRDIGRVTRDFAAAGMDLRHLYERLLVPRDWLTQEQWEGLADGYVAKMAAMREAAGLKAAGRDAARRQIERVKVRRLADREKAWVDWADLSAELQLLLMQRVADDEGLLGALVWADHSGTGNSCWCIGIDAGIISHNKAVVSDRYHPGANAEMLLGLLEQGETAMKSTEPEGTVTVNNEAIFADCMDVETMRVLT